MRFQKLFDNIDKSCLPQDKTIQEILEYNKKQYLHLAMLFDNKQQHTEIRLRQLTNARISLEEKCFEIDNVSKQLTIKIEALKKEYTTIHVF